MTSAQAGLLQTDTIVLHACYARGAVRLWAESAGRLGNAEHAPGENGSAENGTDTPTHPFAASADDIARAIGLTTSDTDDSDSQTSLQTSAIALRLPAAGSGPVPSDRADLAIGHAPDADEGTALATYSVESLEIPFDRYRAIFETAIERAGTDIEDRFAATSSQASDDQPDTRVVLGESIEFFATLGLFAHHLLAQQPLPPHALPRPDRPQRRLDGMARRLENQGTRHRSRGPHAPGRPRRDRR